MWVLISSWSLLFLSTCGDLLTVNFSFLVGRGIGPLTLAPVLFAVLIISRALLSNNLETISIITVEIVFSNSLYEC